MYHALLLKRLLDVINLLSMNYPDEALWPLLKSKAAVMAGWLQQMLTIDDEMPMVNDSANGIAPDLKDLITYLARLNILPERKTLLESGYRKYHHHDLEVLLDVGEIGPDHQLGHAH